MSESHETSRHASSRGVVLDGQGTIAGGRSDTGADPIVVLLAEQVSDAHVVRLRAENGVSYILQRAAWL